MKKFLSVLLLILLIISICPMGFSSLTASAETKNTSGYYTYTVSDGKATITDVDTSIGKYVTIPSTLGGYPVTSIGACAFERHSQLTSITIPDSITSIGYEAFMGRSIENVYISDLESWCNISFGVPDSTQVDDNQYEYISNPLYYGNNLYLNGELVTDLVIPDTVTKISAGAFIGCRSLTSITIPENVELIGEKAFYRCSNLTTVNINAKDYKVELYYDPLAFDTDDWPFSYYYSPFSCCEKLTTVNFGENVTAIPDMSFYYCSKLTNIIIPDGVTSIGSEAFSGCFSLKSITIPDSVTSIGSDAFGKLDSCESDYRYNLRNIYYRGSIEDKKLIEMDSDGILNANWYYDSCIGTTEHTFNYEGYCTVCEELESIPGDEENAETEEHTWDSGSVTKAATCKETGTKTYTCTEADCGATRTETIEKTNNHTFGSWKQTKAPTCKAKGTESRTCSTCQKVETRDIAATGHSLGSWKTTKEATCKAKGEQTRSCSKCSHKETKAINALGHKFSNPTVTKQPTCTETGVESGKCIRCNRETTNTIKATGHKIENHTVTLEPTCTAEGKKGGTCVTCGAKAEETIAAKGHVFGDAVVTKEATETEEGVKTFTCTICGDTKEEVIPYITTETDADINTSKPNIIVWVIIAIGVGALIGGGVTAVMFIKKKRQI